MLLLSVLPNDRTIDIHVHDTVLIIAGSHIFGSLGILLLFFGLIYSLVHKILFSKTLAWIHIIATILFFIFLIIISFVESSNVPRRYNYNPSFYLSNRITVGFSVVAILAQFIFLFNIFAGLIRKLFKSKNS